jgi:hypothetical protein
VVVMRGRKVELLTELSFLRIDLWLVSVPVVSIVVYFGTRSVVRFCG